MPRLVTVADLLTNLPEENDQLFEKARGLCVACETVLAQDRGDAHARAPGIHPSEISGCKRKVVYSLLGEERRDESAPIWKVRFQMGHVVHALLQNQFAKIAKMMGLGVADVQNWHISFNDEVTVAPHLQALAKKWEVHGHCDGIFVIRESWDGPAILRIALEIKSESPDQYAKLRGPKPDHVEQGHVYMACLDVPLIWYLYYNKGNQNYTSTDPVYLIKFDHRIWKNLEDRFEECHDAAAKNELPDREESVKCEFCPFAWTCQPPQLMARSKGTMINRPPWNTIRGPR